MTIELLDTENEEGGAETVADAEKWSSYVESYADGSTTAPLDRKPNAVHGDHSDDDKDGDVRSCSGGKAVFLSRNLRMFGDHGASCSRTNSGAKANSSVVEEKSSTSSATPVDEPTPAPPTDPIEQLERKLQEKGVPQRVNNAPNHAGLESADHSQCKLNSTTSKMLFVVNKENYLYKRSALTRAKQCHPEVTKRLNGKFRTWHKAWCGSHITDTQHKSCTDWLMGRCEGVVANRTRVLSNNDLKRTPYAPYNRYRVEYLDSTAPEAAAPVSATQTTPST